MFANSGQRKAAFIQFPYGNCRSIIEVISMAKPIQKDDMLGEIKGKVLLYGNGLDSSGEIILCEEGLIVRAEGNTIKAPFRYVTMFEKSKDLPLGKVGVEMDVYDQSGNKHYFHAGIAEQHFTLIKRAISGTAKKAAGE